MMMKFILDTHLPPRLKFYFKALGHDAMHTTDIFNGHLLLDQEIRAIAITEGRIVVTKDSDFFDNFILNGAPPKVLFIKYGNISNRILYEAIENFLTKIVEEFEAGGKVVVLEKDQMVIY